VDVRAERVSKRFTSTQALADVSIALAAGEIHAIVGENGAGKSTLIKILGGALRPDSGRVLVADRECRFASPADAQGAGIVVIPQDLVLVPALSVADNIRLGAAPTRRVAGLLPCVDRRRMRAEAAAALARLGFAPDLDARADSLPHAQRQMVAIARALSRRARLLILDEPTAALERREVDRLLETLAALKRQGEAIAFISHRLDEVMAIADRITVLRDGRVVAQMVRAEFDRPALIRAITGRDIDAGSTAAPAAPADRIALAAETDAGAVALRAGRVTGLAGLLGSGTGRLIRRLFGAVATPQRIAGPAGPAVLRSPADAIRARIGMVPGERATALVYGLSVRENILLAARDFHGSPLVLRRRDGLQLVRDLVDALDIRPRDPEVAVRRLSGGNQQKVVFARWLAARVAVLLLEEPTQGVDVAAKGQIHRLIRAFAAEGGSALLASSEAEELLALGDPVLVMRGGAIVAELARGPALSEGSLRQALGG
jgi:ABC-type sugar transport system ATPase subunit